MRPAWPLVGREDELEFVEEVIDRSEPGVVFAGPAGVGKTRLATEAVAGAAARGRRTAWAVATRAASEIPFGALAHLLPAEFPSAAGPPNLIRAASDVLVGAEDDARTVVAVDDAHLLDELSAALLLHLAMSRRACVLVTVRSGERTHDSVAAMWKEGLARRVELGDLSRVDMERLVEAAVGSQVDGPTLERLWRLTKGNPLFLREVLLAALEAGDLVDVDGVWHWEGQVAVLPRLEAVTELRLAALGPEEQEAVEVIALGEPLGPAILRRLVADDALSSLERQRVVSTVRIRRRLEVRLAHPLYGEVIRRQILPLRSSAIHAELADALEECGARRREDLLRLATWLLETLKPARPDILLAAARRAMELADFRFAERFATAAVDVGGGFEASELAAASIVSQGRFEEAELLLGPLERDAPTAGERVRISIARATNLAANLGRLPEALSVLQGGEAAAAGVNAREQLAGLRAVLLVYAGRPEEGVATGRAILAGEGTDRVAVGWATAAVAGALLYAGRTSEAQEVMTSGNRLAPGYRGTVDVLGDFSLYRFLATLFEGRLADAGTLAANAYRLAVEQGVDWASGIWAGCRGSVEIRRGRPQSAARLLREACATLRQADVLGLRSTFLGELSHALALVGDVRGAEQALAEAEVARRSSQRFDEGYIGLGRVWTLAAKGEISAAVAFAAEEAETLRSFGHHVLQATALHDVARLGEPDEVADALHRLAQQCDGELLPAFARHAAALAEDDGPQLHEVSLAFEAIEARLLAAEAAAGAARAYRREGRTASAAAASARGKRLMSRCEGSRTPGVSEIDGELPLTRREREVAALAARGLTSREIAASLVLSVRTVDNHLHSAYTKLGVHAREDLAAILEPPSAGLVPHTTAANERA